MRLYLTLINKWDSCLLQNIVTVFILAMTKLGRHRTVYTTTKQKSELIKLACTKLCLCVSIPYNSHSLQETSSNIFRQNKNSLGGSLSLLWLMKQQNKIFSNNLCHAIFTLARCANSQLFKMRDSLTFCLFTLFIRRWCRIFMFFSLVFLATLDSCC